MILFKTYYEEMRPVGDDIFHILLLFVLLAGHGANALELPSTASLGCLFCLFYQIYGAIGYKY